MELSDTPTVTPSPAAALLFCALCDKPFIKESQHKRHMAYCSRSKGRTRPRSCRACNESKIKCNYCVPCQQCLRKGNECVYEVPQARRGRAANSSKPSTIDGTTDTNTATTSAATEASRRDSGMILSEPGSGRSRMGLESVDTLEHLNSEQALEFSTVTDMSLWQYSSIIDEGPDIMYSGPRVPVPTSTARTTTAEDEDFMSLLHHSSSLDFDSQMEYFSYNSGKELQMPKFSPALPPACIAKSSSSLVVPSPSGVVSRITRSLAFDKSSSGHFTKNKVHTSDRQIFATMIIDMIHAYPRMMMRRETFPPFIHTCSPNGGNQDDRSRLHENLTNCMGIAQLFAVCNDDTRLFVWGTIWAELRRLRSQASTFKRYDALSALQASLLYLIMRAMDDPPREVNQDFEMLEIYQVVLKSRFIELADDSSRVEERSQDTQWADWIFLESGRRIGWIWFILALVFHLDTGVPCFVSKHFRELPLPCTKTEWEAKTEAQWRKEQENAAARSKSTALHTLGDLIDAQKLSSRDGESEGLDIWNAGLDHLGVLLNLAVQLV